MTGASRGIGASVARSFAKAGAAVALASRDETALAGVAAQIRDDGGTALVVPADVGDEAAVASLVEAVLTQFGRLDFACNNAAGGGHRPTPLADVPVEAFDSGLTITLRGVFLAMKYETSYVTGAAVVIDGGKLAGTPPFQVQLSPET